MTVRGNPEISVKIGTSGFSYSSWFSPNVFYPPNVRTLSDQLRYYVTRFNMVTISNTYESDPDTSLYEEWAAIAGENKNFSFVVTAPKKFTDSHSVASSIKEWDRFWNGYGVAARKNTNCFVTGPKKGGCKVLHEKGVLGCILLRFSSAFHFSSTHVNKILKITKLAPQDVKFAFLFLHCSWRENREKINELFQTRSNWCISTPFVENRLVDFGWAGGIPSTRTFDTFSNTPVGKSTPKGPSIILTTDFVHISLSGTLGSYLGSYDKNGFLERFAKEIEKLKSIGVKTIFCSFDATTSGTTFCNPLPGLIISGFFLNPKLADLPSHTLVDRPCCLHDAIRLQELLKNSEPLEGVEKTPRLGVNDTLRYKRDSDGFVDIKFV